HLLLGVLAGRIDRYEDDPIAVLLGPVPRAVLGEEDAVLVLGREHVAGVELHAERRDVRAELDHGRGELGALVAHTELGIGDVALVAVGIAEVLTHARDVVELVGRNVVAQPVAGVFAEPQITGSRVDGAADAIAHAQRHELGAAGLGIDPAPLPGAGRRDADVAGHADGNIEPALA